jgi:hypothetical protein
MQLRALRNWNLQYVPGVGGFMILIKYEIGPSAAILFASAALLAIFVTAAVWSRPPVDVFADRIAEIAEHEALSEAASQKP